MLFGQGAIFLQFTLALCKSANGHGGVLVMIGWGPRSCWCQHFSRWALQPVLDPIIIAYAYAMLVWPQLTRHRFHHCSKRLHNETTRWRFSGVGVTCSAGPSTGLGLSSIERKVWKSCTLFHLFQGSLSKQSQSETPKLCRSIALVLSCLQLWLQVFLVLSPSRRLPPPLVLQKLSKTMHGGARRSGRCKQKPN